MLALIVVDQFVEFMDYHVWVGGSYSSIYSYKQSLRSEEYYGVLAVL
jgi:hypothetical protein